MSDNFKNFYNGINLQPISSDPSNPKEGDLQMSDGTHRTKGMWRYDGAAWQAFAGVSNPVIATKSGAYTLLSTDDTILADAVGGIFSLTLPAAASNVGKIFNIAKIDASANAVTIDGNGGEFIEGVITTTLDRQYQSIQIQSNGTGWFVISGRHQLDSVVQVHTSNGYGATNTKIRRYTTVAINVGTAITYADEAGPSATDGGSFTIEEFGIYYIAMLDDSNAAGNHCAGITLNSAQLTTNIQSITSTDRLSANVSQGNTTITPAGWIGPLSPTDVIRSHNNGAAVGSASNASFIIIKLGRV